MNLFVRSNPSLSLHIHGVLRALCFSTDTTAISHSLNRRISMVEDPKVPIIPVLEKWVQEGQVVTNSDLKHFIRKLRKIHRFSHALQGHNLSPGDVAVRLDLISKVHGLEQAVTYFNSVPESLRGLEVYGALLNCYAHYKAFGGSGGHNAKNEGDGISNGYLKAGLIDKTLTMLWRSEQLISDLYINQDPQFEAMPSAGIADL
ncbi:hypothetical protein D5086_025029 [Populus alba]|uniref:Uncharacterized protein n=1 Tax=Populus alba TaxID=43335 RepID=A0ACC4B804_POPAL